MQTMTATATASSEMMSSSPPLGVSGVDLLVSSSSSSSSVPINEQQQQQPKVVRTLETSLMDNKQLDDQNNDTSMVADKVESSSNNMKETLRHSPSSQPSFDWNLNLPKCEMPPPAEFDPVQTFVANTIQEQHLLMNQHEEEQQRRRNSNNHNSTATSAATVALTDAYRGLMDLLRHRNDIVMLRYILLALRTSDDGNTLHRLTSAGNQHVRLLHQIVRLNPFIEVPVSSSADSPTSDSPTTTTTTRIDYALADAHLSLLIAIVSKKTVFLVPTMTSLWKMLSQIKRHNNSDDPNVPAAQLLPPAPQTQRLHAALATLMRLVPKSKTELFGIVLSNSPFLTTRTVQQITWYYQQAFFVCVHYLPSMRNSMLEMVVQKCLELDVEIKMDQVGQGQAAVMIDPKTAANKEDTDDAIFQLDMDDDDKPKKPQAAVAEAATATTTTTTVDEQMADKLDSLMLLLLEYVEQQSTPQLVEIYHVFYNIFESSILITHKSKFVQFLLLHICSIEYKRLHEDQNDNANNNNNSNDGQDHDIEQDDEEEEEEEDETMYRDFAIKLINVIIDPYRSSTTRQAGACYLASFISRTNCVCAETVCEAVCALLRWAEAYMQSLDNSSHDGIAKQYAGAASDAREQCNLHALFYTICQAAFYIICFRGKDAISFSRKYMNPANGYDNDVALIDLGMSRWTRLVGHATLQPLRYCLESVRLEFLHVARIFHLAEPDVLSRLETMAERIMSEKDSDSSSKNATVKTPNKTKSLPPARPRGTRQSLSLLLRARQKKKATGGSAAVAGNKLATAATLEKERITGGVGGLGGGTNPLDSFFPFDPFLLRRSHDYIEPYYHHWNGSLSQDDYDGSYDHVEDEEGLDVEDASDLEVDDDDDDDDDEEEDDANMMSDEDEEDENDSDDEDDDHDFDEDNSDIEEDVVDEFAATSLTSSASASHQPMAMTPTTNATTTTLSSMPGYMVKREELRRAWSEQHDRSARRQASSAASSLENGSW